MLLLPIPPLFSSIPIWQRSQFPLLCHAKLWVHKHHHQPLHQDPNHWQLLFLPWLQPPPITRPKSLPSLHYQQEFTHSVSSCMINTSSFFTIPDENANTEDPCTWGNVANATTNSHQIGHMNNHLNIFGPHLHVFHWTSILNWPVCTFFMQAQLRVWEPNLENQHFPCQPQKPN